MSKFLTWQRLIPLAVGMAMMSLALSVQPFDRGLLTIPLTLAIGLLFARWYTSLSGSKVNDFWEKVVQARRWPASSALPVCLTLLLALMPSLGRGFFPLPGNHDEMSYHLASDTFVHGRLANQKPAGWEHFESFHINVVPAYCSKYQPGMGLMLALGQTLGHPYIGVLIALVLATVALDWMFHQWFSPIWATAGTLLACFPLCGNWSDCYFVGGPLATIGGAILVGMFRALQRRSVRWYDGCVLALSLVILFWTRPFEGGIVAAMVGVPLFIQVLRQHGIRSVIWPLLPGGLLILIPAGLFQSELNLACTGNRWLLPYLEHEKQYGRTPLFLLQSPRDDVPSYRHEQIRLFNAQMMDWYEKQRSPRHFLRVLEFKFGVAWTYFYCMLWLLPLAVLPELCRNSNSRLLLLVWFGLLVILQIVSWFLHHYAGPAFPAWSILVILSIRLVCRWRYRAFPLGRFLAVMLISGYCSQIFFERTMACIYSSQSWMVRRAALQRELLESGNQHLVFLQYGAGHNTGEEWVYNSADIAGQQVIWARSMSLEKDRQLTQYYPGRRIWLLEVNSEQKDSLPQLKPYVMSR